MLLQDVTGGPGMGNRRHCQMRSPAGRLLGTLLQDRLRPGTPAQDPSHKLYLQAALIQVMGLRALLGRPVPSLQLWKDSRTLYIQSAKWPTH